jgi:hypothetical protein
MDNTREDLFLTGKKLFGPGHRIQGIVQNSNPNLVQKDLEDCYELVREEIKKKELGVKEFEANARKWFGDLRDAFVAGKLK